MSNSPKDLPYEYSDAERRFFADLGVSLDSPSVPPAGVYFQSAPTTLLMSWGDRDSEDSCRMAKRLGAAMKAYSKGGPYRLTPEFDNLLYPKDDSDE